MSQINKNDFVKIVSNIKNEIRTTQVRTMQQVNSNLIMMYFRIGKILSENGRYGNKFIDNVSRNLKLEFPNIEGFSVRNLKYMKKFYLEYKDDEIVQRSVAQLPWRHNIALMSKIKDNGTRKLYANATVQNGWSRDMLVTQIDSKYHLRIGRSSNNFKELLPSVDGDLANNVIKDPYILDFLEIKDSYKERDLELAMVDKIKKLLLELGKGFSFVGNQYEIKTKHGDFYIDLLFYHLDLRRYIVVELKATEFKPEYIGQLGFYVTAVNETLRRESDEQTIGLLICREKDRLITRWALKSTNVPIGVSTYELDSHVPEGILDQLPSEEELNLYMGVG